MPLPLERRQSFQERLRKCGLLHSSRIFNTLKIRLDESRSENEETEASCTITASPLLLNKNRARQVF